MAPRALAGEGTTMSFVTLHIALGTDGRGAIGLTREAASAALPGRTVATASFACWNLSAAMIRAGTLPIQFVMERNSTRGTTPVKAG
jgi:hypothetical protein